MKIGDAVFYGLTIVVPACLICWAMMALLEMVKPLLTALGTR